MDTPKEHPLDKAARVIGSATKLARCLGKTKGALGQWKEEGRRVPPEVCPTIERLTREAGEIVTCEELCPTGVEWDEVRRNAAAPQPAQEPSHV